MRPLLLLDVDGVIAVLTAGCREPTFEIMVNEVPLTIPVGMPTRIRRLERHFQLVWATSMELDANRYVAPALGLDQIGVVRLSEPFELGETWKLPSIRAYVRDRPFAWADDEIGEDALRWAESRDEPCLLLRTHPGRCLDDDDAGRLIEFAEACDEA